MPIVNSFWARSSRAAAVALIVACGGQDDGAGGLSSTGSVMAPTPGAQPMATTPPTGSAMTPLPVAGSGAMPPNQGTVPEPTGDPVAAPPEPMDSITSDECMLATGQPGDDLCILAPPPDQGFQIHIGPSDYDNPEPQYVLEPGVEDTSNFPATATNATEVYFYRRQYRMRPGSHHMILTQTSASGATFGGRRIATANISSDYPAGGVSAPENEDVGIPLPARANVNVSLHSINVTDKPLIREIWVNFWYRDAAKVTEEAQQLFASGDVGFAIQPGQDTILGPYRCNIQAPGRMLWFYGHRHASNVRFSAWRVRGTQRDLFYEGYHWEEPVTLEYASTIQNPVPDPVKKIDGGFSGILEVTPGDQLEWECHVINMQDAVLRFTNETYLGEMCIMDAELVGTSCTSAGAGGFPGL
jgi:hypothetical protein